MTVEINFISPDWIVKERFGDRLVKDTELVDPGNNGRFERGSQMFVVHCGTSWIGWERMGEREKHSDDGAEISFWDLRSTLEVPEGKGIRLDKDLGGRVFTKASAEIREGGSAKLIVDGEVLAEIQHIPLAS